MSRKKGRPVLQDILESEQTRSTVAAWLKHFDNYLLSVSYVNYVLRTMRYVQYNNIILEVAYIHPSEKLVVEYDNGEMETVNIGHRARSPPNVGTTVCKKTWRQILRFC